MRPLLATLSLLSLLAAPAGPQNTAGLKLVVLQGEGAFNDIRRKTGRDPVVEVRDEKDRPVAGAQVVFTLPEAGPSGTFAGGGQTHTTTSGANGMAAAPGLKPNDVEGRFPIRVTATLGGRTASITISQNNTLAGGAVATGQQRGGGKKWLLVVVGAGASGGVLAATRRGGSSAPAPPPPTVLSAGTVTVGGPR